MRAAFPIAGTSVAVFLAAALSACPPGEGTPDAGQDAGPDPEILSPNEDGWWRDDVFYEVFVRSFQDSAQDGVGDLAGLTFRLDYLNDGNAATTTDLGVQGLWLMPIFPSPSYHGYDVVDYYDVHPQYGTLGDLDALVSAAHARGIKVILDLVVNHTASNHPWFIDARSSPTAARRNWYVWRDTKPTGWRQPFGSGEVWHSSGNGWFYGVYNAGMPDLNWRNPEVEAEFVKIMKFWLARGVDGFRFDAVRYLVEQDDGKNADVPETHDVFQRLRHAVHQDYPDALFVAEAWTVSATAGGYYGEGNEFQLGFAFDLARASWTSINAGTRTAVNQEQAFALAAAPDPGYWAPFLTNHDQRRVMRELGNALPKARLAAATLMAQPGTPFLYYGEELGMMGGPATDDRDKRTPFRWTATGPQYGFTRAAASWYGATTEDAAVNVASQQADQGSLWHLYRRLIARRTASAALATGAVARPGVTGGGDGVWAVLRTAASGERVLFVANYAAAASGPFTVAVTGTPTVLESEGLASAPAPQSAALSFVDLAPQSFAFIRLD